MILDYTPTYNKYGFHKGFKANTPYYVAYVNNDSELDTISVFVESVYAETLHDRESHTIWYVKLYLPEDYYKTIFHKLLNIKSRKYNLCNDYIHIGFVKDSEIDAKISYLNIMRNSHKTILSTINKLHDEFADKHPDLYLSKILTYKGLRCSYPPQYQSILNKTERSSIQAFSI